MTNHKQPRGPRRLFDVEAERRVIACAMLKPDALDEIQTVLRERDFSENPCRLAFAYLVQQRESGKPLDRALLPKMTEFFDAVELARMAKMVPSVANARYYSEQVRELSRLRDAADAADQTIEEVFGGDLDADRILGNAIQRFSDAGEDGLTREPTIVDVFEATRRRLDSPDEEAGLLSGLPAVDALSDGFRPGQLIVLAARTSLGKTALALTMSANAALGPDRSSVVYFSLEMPAEELMRRLIAMRLEIPLAAINHRDVTDAEHDRIVDFRDEIRASRLHIIDDPSLRVAQIAAHARRYQRLQKGLDLVVVDYLTEIQPDDEREPRERQVARMAGQLKLMARQMKVPVLCLAQLNRETEAAKDRRPRLHHLRDSGAIEQAADIVLLIHREDPEADAGDAEIVVAKHRNGKRGSAKVAWRGMFTTFADLAPERFSEFDDFNAGRTPYRE